MKKIFVVGLSGVLFFTACENTNSSTVGTYEKEETSQSSEKSEGESHSAEVKEHTQNTTTDTVKASGDTSLARPEGEIKTGEKAAADSTK
jgi:hypothetical protein